MAGENCLKTQQYLKSLDNDKCSNTMAAENSNSALKKIQLTLTTNCRNSDLGDPPKVIYVNPNYGVRKHVIHVNPNIHAKVSIHVNNKINSKTSTHLNSNVSTKTSIYLNPKIVKNMDVMHHLQEEENMSISSTESSEPNTLKGKIQNSVYINPKLLEKISSAEIEQNAVSEKKVVTEYISYTVCSKLNVKSVIQKNCEISNVIPLPCRNIVRLKRNSKGASSTLISTSNKVKRISGTGLKIANVKDSTLLATASRSCQVDSLLQFVKSKNEVSQYKVDKMVDEKRKTKSSRFARREKL